MKIKIYNSIMGSGKTTHMISQINNHPDNFYFIVLPYLSEIDRYRNGCTTRYPLIDPCANSDISKSEHLHSLLTENECNIATTHAMMEHLTQEHLTALHNKPLKQGEKILVLDETIDLVKVVSSKKLPKHSLVEDIKNEYIIVNETTGVVKWNPKKDASTGYPHHTYLKSLCDTGMLYFLDNNYIVVETPVDFLNCFDTIIILTYRWEYSIMAQYLRVNGYTWKVESFNEQGQLKLYKKVLNNLIVCENYNENNLSASGLRNIDPNETKQTLNQLVKNAMKEYNVPLEKMFFTTFKTIGEEGLLDWYSTLKIGKWVKKDSFGKVVPVTFLAHNIMGTNEYAECSLAIYALDKHLHPGVFSYFAKRGMSLDGEEWALSSMLQWLFRGCIRQYDDDKKMIAVIPSRRMRGLLVGWLAELRMQVEMGKIDTSEVEILTPAKRRTKKQQYNQWLERNPELMGVYSFKQYLKFGGPALRRMSRKG